MPLIITRGAASAKGFGFMGKSNTVPGAPTATGSNAISCSQVTVSFTAPSSNGGSPILYYTGKSSPCCITTTGASSPITMAGLNAGTCYTFTVTATNAIGTGPASGATPSARTFCKVGSTSYTCSGTYSWVAPAGVNYVSVVVVGGGGGAGGFYGCGTAGGTSSFNSSVYAYGGQSTGCAPGGGGSGGNGGGTGGRGRGSHPTLNPIGGGAGGYSGNGGNASCCTGPFSGGYGGGVGIFGQGSNGAGGSPGGGAGSGGGGGGGGGNGCSNGSPGGAGSGGCGINFGGGFGGGTGGGLGGGGGGLRYGNTISVTPGNSYTVVVGIRGKSGNYGYNAGSGAVRIVYPGNTRKFPSTCVGSP